MIRLHLLFAFFAALSIPAFAQGFGVCMEVVASSGGQGIQSNRHIAWTIGEPFVQTQYGASYAITQGFHQPDPCGANFVGTSELADWGISLFPNPTDGLALLRFSPEKNGVLLASAFDLLGRSLLEDLVLASPEGSAIDASSWPSGVYFLLLKDPISKTTAVFRLVRL